VQQRLRITHRIIHGIVGVSPFAQMFKIGERIFYQALIKRTQIGRAISEGLFAEKVAEISVFDEPTPPNQDQTNILAIASIHERSLCDA
jgi:hypothetical protein